MLAANTLNIFQSLAGNEFQLQFQDTLNCQTANIVVAVGCLFTRKTKRKEMKEKKGKEAENLMKTTKTITTTSFESHIRFGKYGQATKRTEPHATTNMRSFLMSFS